MDNLVQKFKSHRANAEARGIAFRLTFAEWWSVWEPHWPRRHLDSLAMCRDGDEGDYALGNVHITTRTENLHEQRDNFNNAKALRPTDDARQGLNERLRAQELSALLDAVKVQCGNVSAAARQLGITFRQARYILQKNGMSKRSLFLSE